MARPPERTTTGLWDRLRGALSRREPAREPAAPPRREPPAPPREDPRGSARDDPRADGREDPGRPEPGAGRLPDRPDDGPAGPRPDRAASDRMPVYDSRPRVLIRGTFDVSSRLSEFRVDERANRPMRCALTFTTSPDSLLNGGSVRFGDEVEVLIGAPEVRLFKGILLSVGIARKDGGDRQAEIVACDRLVQMEYSRKTRGFEDSDVDSILTNLASEHSFSAEISVASPSMKQQVQANETDLEFAARMAEAVGAEIWIDDREFYAAAWHDRPGTTIQIDAGTAFDDFSVAADLRGQPEAVDVRGWDALHGETVSSVADDVSGQSQSGRPAADILQQIGLAAGSASVVHTGA